jgi:LmbE family N-acetylglucosaminyl deacetylase
MTIAALLPEPDGRYRALAIGAHADDIEIGAGGTVTRILAERPGLTIDFVVLTGDEGRRAEAEASATSLAGGRLGSIGIRTLGLADGHLPSAGARPKEEIERLKSGGPYDLVICPSLGDAHQDHRLVAEIAWQTFRLAPILEYEIPKYEGIREQPNLFVELTREGCEAKVAHLLAAFPSQLDRGWFDAETFWAMLRLRGVEAASSTGYAEAFVARKLRI